ncbi:PAS/PAC sensor signal transduction histidine kinase [Ancylobacter novellus DSM 506]|uniref:Sensor protein FixL n=1 Tax=Ancylobacter novellus (strain ATCC 8093 / DSM 506 / JCM 20403 / CCM 1077 / IAM 12100 / NBRC 12443 / NCIMB 10456) TaxID=639283 RepID=D7A011_ANCN5|nr:ATP-binding protein [Ancylobacter novellus]ADH87425.1 PAS/PAC sensor signal transduction histidine kinase [Ancylobacter novellus DSM 506]
MREFSSPPGPLPPPTVSEARLLSVLDTAADGIIVIDEHARILIFNKACEKMFGIAAAEAIGQNVRIVMPIEYAREHDEYLGSYIRTGVKKIIGIGREVRGRHIDGTIFPLELSVGEAATPDGRQFIGILRDLRPRKESEQRLADLQSELVHLARVSAIDEMGAAIAHELNQPLTALMLYLQAIRRAHAKGVDIVKVVGEILDKAAGEAERAGHIIQRMRQFVEKREPERHVRELDPLIDEAIDLTLLGQRHRIRIDRKQGTNLPPVSVDPVQVQQIVVNLVRNAIEAAAGMTDPAIHIRTRSADGTVVLEVQDNGPGIAPEALSKLFEAFASSKRRGMGLGLAISRTIAQNHGGDLLVDPGGNGRGACFSLVLPAAAAPAEVG